MTSSALRAPRTNGKGPQTAPANDGRMSYRQVLTILAGLLLGMFLAALDQTIVGTAMPRIANDLHGLNLQAWATTAYLITSTITTPLYGKLSDMYGRKPFYLAAISIFLIGSAASSFASSMYTLAAFRAFQGIGAGGLMSLAFTILGDIVAPRDRAKYMGYFMAVFGTSSVLGPVVGGALSGANSILGIAGWRWVFLVNVPIGAIALVVVAKVLNVPHRGQAQHKIDWWGALTLIVGLVPLLIVAQQGQQWGWHSTRALICYGIAAIGIVAFILVEHFTRDHALIPLRLFRNGAFSVIILASVIVGIGMFGGIALIPQYLQIAKGASPTTSGLEMLPMMVGLMGAATVSGQITSRTGRYKIFPILGSLILIGGSLLFTRIAADSPMWQPMLYMLVFGTGIGLCMQTLNLAAQNAAPVKDLGVATASATFFRQTGGTLGVAVFLSILFSTVGSKITSAIRVALPTPQVQAALHDPNVAGNPVNQPVLHMFASGGGNVGGVLQDSSFIQRIDPRLAEPFKVGFSQSVGLVFWVTAAVAVLLFAVVLFVKEIPLRTQSGMAAMVEGAEQVGPEVSWSPAQGQSHPNGADATRPTMATVGTPISGVLRRADRTAVQGAVLTLVNHGGQQVARTTTGPDGSYRLSAPLDGVYVLIASSLGYHPQASTVRVAGAPLRIDMRFTGSARATGVVRVAEADVDQVIPGAMVTLTNARGEVVGSMATGPDGRFAFDGLLSGNYTLVASAPHYQLAAVALVVPEYGDAVADVVLSGAARLAGTTRAESGQAVPDVRVTLVDSDGQVVARTDTDQQGRYTFAGLPSGEYTVIASGYPPVSGHRRIVAGQDSQHDVQLSHSDM